MVRTRLLAVRLAKFGWVVDPTDDGLDTPLPFPDLGADADLTTLEEFESDYEVPPNAPNTPIRLKKRATNPLERLTGPRDPANSDSSSGHRSRKRRRGEGAPRLTKKQVRVAGKVKARPYVAPIDRAINRANPCSVSQGCQRPRSS